MMSILSKEINQFFSSMTGFIALVVFFIAMGLIVFIFPETSVLDYGYATLDPFFEAAPYVLLFLIPAITMRLFSEEKAARTLELLRTKPLRLGQIILGKYFASVFIILLTLIPTLIFVFIVGQLAEPVNNIDYGGIFGSYIGLFLLACCFAAIGLFASSVSTNQIVAFILALFLCFVMYYAFTSISSIPFLVGKSDYIIQQFGMESHYTSMSRGVVSLRDIVYFLMVLVAFLWLTNVKLQLETE